MKEIERKELLTQSWTIHAIIEKRYLENTTTMGDKD